jgi:hypothetical protein
MPPTVILLIQFVGALQLGQCKWCANLVTGRWWLNRKTSKSLSLKTRGIRENLCNSWQKNINGEIWHSKVKIRSNQVAKLQSDVYVGILHGVSRFFC